MTWSWSKDEKSPAGQLEIRIVKYLVAVLTNRDKADEIKLLREKVFTFALSIA